MGLTFHDPAGDRDAAAASAARKEPAAEAVEPSAHPAGDPGAAASASATREERIAALVASALRICDELTAACDRVQACIQAWILGASATARRFVEGADGPGYLAQHFRLGEEVVADVRALVLAREALERHLAALEYERRLARARAATTAGMAALAVVEEAFANRRLMAAAATRTAADTGSSAGDLESAQDMDHK
ncbi:hypothetical protein ACP70R_042366 [Stipagrostis hirtigluma subsp. patula]